MKKIYFITSNDYKFQIANKALMGSGFELVQQQLETPEIQSDSVDEIAAYSARWAADKLKYPIILTDAGCFIEALNGFPGPFIKYVNGYFTAQDFLNLMIDKKNRQAVFKDCLAYCEPGKDPVLFTSIAPGTISDKVGQAGKTAINEIFIPAGFDKPESEIPTDQRIDFWNKHVNNFELLADYLKSK